ncbi:hypothetical protein AMECASPLE_027612 [Ameca splendens]|uniref:Uncharacterized protein n=1 Tax=Ameca splendens TaxID=208324 RepID=A0ABV0XU62_9TELE
MRILTVSEKYLKVCPQEKKTWSHNLTCEVITSVLNGESHHIPVAWLLLSTRTLRSTSLLLLLHTVRTSLASGKTSGGIVGPKNNNKEHISTRFVRLPVVTGHVDLPPWHKRPQASSEAEN